MTHDDVAFLQRLLTRGHIQSPCLEVGVGWEVNAGEGLSKRLITNQGIEYVGADQQAGPLVDIVADFSGSADSVQHALGNRRFASVLCMNMLEHVFDPVQTAKNLLAAVAPGGTWIVLTPVVWPLHECPIDCWRINPNFYEEFAKREHCELVSMEYAIGDGVPVADVTEWNPWTRTRVYALPRRATGWRDVYSRAVHKLLRTSGRGAITVSNVAIGAVVHKD